MARQPRPAAFGEEVEPIAEAAGNAVDAERGDTRRRQLDRERNAVEPPADARRDDRVARMGVVPRFRRVRPHVEEPDGSMARHILHVDVVVDGHVEGRHTIDVLLGGAQRLAARGEHPRQWARPQHGLGHRGGHLDHVLAIVDDEEQMLGPQGHRDAVGGHRTGPERQAEGGSDGDRDEVGIGERPELREPGAIEEPWQQLPRRLERQSCLADATRAGQGHEAVCDDQVRDVAERSLPPDQLGLRRGKVREARRHGGAGRHPLADLAGELVPAAGHGSNEIAIGAEHLAQCGDLPLEVILLDNPVGPYPVHQFVLAEDSAPGVDEDHEGIERASAEFDRPAVGEQLSAMADHRKAAKFNGL